jgi:hypothetical protein
MKIQEVMLPADPTNQWHELVQGRLRTHSPLTKHGVVCIGHGAIEVQFIRQLKCLLGLRRCHAPPAQTLHRGNW